METPTAIIEISNSSIKLVVGLVIDKKASIIYKKIIPLKNVVQNGQIMDPSALTLELKKIRNLADPEAKLRLTIGDATLIYPAIGFSIYECERATNVVSNSYVIEQIDIQNAISLIQKERIPAGSGLVDIIPSIFYLDGNRSYGMPPISEKSGSISLRAFVHTLPSQILEDYNRVVDSAEIRVKRGFVSSYAIGEAIRNDHPEYKQYFLLDLGEDITNIAFIAEHYPYSSTYIEDGASRLRKMVSEKLGIEEDIAQEFIERYGVDVRGSRFSPKLIDKAGNKYNFTERDLASIIEDFLAEYAKNIYTSLSTITATYSEKVRVSPIVVTGGFSKLHGLARYLKSTFVDNEIIFYHPEALGARDPRLSALVGALYLSTKYRGSLTDQKAKVGKLTREEKK